MAIATIAQLNQELIDRVKTVPTFANNSYSIYDMEDLMRQAELQSYPIVGVGYNGAVPVTPNDKTANVASLAHAVRMVELQFLVVVAIQYQFAGMEDTKPQATDLLDEIRSVIFGFKGVNSRAWVFMGERPEPDASTDGVVFYSQVWHTVIPVVGNFNYL